jgi:hypothetical protein
MSYANKQKGFALIVVVFMIMSIILSLVSFLYMKSSESYSDLYDSESSRVNLMTRVNEEITSFYISHSNDFLEDSLPAYLTDEYIASNLEIPSRSSAFLQVRVSDIKENDLIRWRNIYAWIPSSDGMDESNFDPSADFENAFTPSDGVRWTSYSGVVHETKRLESSIKQLNDIGRNIQLMGLGNVNDDFFRNASINYFANCEESPDPSPTATAPLPRPGYASNYPSISCAPAGGAAELSSLNAESALGIPSQKMKNNWENPIMIANHSNDDPTGNYVTTHITLNGEMIEYNSVNVPFSFVLFSETSKANTYIHTVVTQIL